MTSSRIVEVEARASHVKLGRMWLGIDQTKNQNMRDKEIKAIGYPSPARRDIAPSISLEVA
jgi:hypothetical protein